jgi:tetratricopeptide (TPR) repeat protein
VVIAAGFVTFKQRLPLPLAVMGVVAAFLLVRSPRFVDIASLLAFPFMALSLSAGGRAIVTSLRGESSDLRQPVRLAVLGAIAASGLSLASVLSNHYFTVTGSASTFGLGVSQDLFPGAACESVLNRPDFPKRALNLAHDGGYLAWRLADRKIFTDTRDELYGAPFYRQYAEALQGHAEAWSKLMESWQPEAVVLNCTWPGAGPSIRHLVLTDQWRLVYFDGTTAILLRLTSENLHLMEEAGMQAEGLRELQAARSDFLRRQAANQYAGNPSRLIGAATVFQAMGQFEEAGSLYDILTHASPRMASAWLGKGVCQFKLDDIHGAKTSLERACRMLPRDALVWLWMGKTYWTLGNQEAAREAYAKARAINPVLYNAFDTGLEDQPRTTLPGHLFPMP